MARKKKLLSRSEAREVAKAIERGEKSGDDYMVCLTADGHVRLREADPKEICPREKIKAKILSLSGDQKDHLMKEYRCATIDKLADAVYLDWLRQFTVGKPRGCKGCKKKPGQT